MRAQRQDKIIKSTEANLALFEIASSYGLLEGLLEILSVLIDFLCEIYWLFYSAQSCFATMLLINRVNRQTELSYGSR